MLGGYGEFMYQTGMIDELQRQYVVQQTDLGVKLIQQEKWVEAFEVRDASLLSEYKSVLLIIISNGSVNKCHFYYHNI